MSPEAGPPVDHHGTARRRYQLRTVPISWRNKVPTPSTIPTVRYASTPCDVAASAQGPRPLRPRRGGGTFEIPNGSRNALSEEVICALLRDFRQHGQKAIARVRETHPAAYLKVLALLVPKEHKVEMANA